MRLPYFAAPRVTLLENTRGGGERSFERIAIRASSWDSQSIAFCTSTMLVGELRA